MKNLYIIEWFFDEFDQKEYDWFWATSEKEAEKKWRKDYEEVDKIELNNMYKVEIPEDVISYIIKENK